MLKKLAAVVVVLAGVGVLVAAEAKGKIKKHEKGMITVTVDGKDVDFKVGKDAKLYDGTTEVTGKKERGKFLKGLKEGDEVTITYETKGKANSITELKKK